MREKVGIFLFEANFICNNSVKSLDTYLPCYYNKSKKRREWKNMVADSITVSRILFSLFLFAFSPHSLPFAGFYLLCGVTDVLDGFAARKLHTESEKGAVLDSVADLFFAGAYAVKILPLLSVPLWILIWAAGIAVIKVTGIVIAGRKAHRLSIAHSWENKLTGILLFLLPLSVGIADAKYGATLVCIVATGAVIREMRTIFGEKK